jgi:excisionase family DNA binding protein
MSSPVETLGKAGRASGIVPALLSDESLAAYLDISPRLVRQWRTTGDIPAPAILPGRLTRWRRADIDAWLASLATKGAGQ